MGCPLDGGDNVQVEKKLCPRSRGITAPSIVRVATRYGWEEVQLPRSTCVIGYYCKNGAQKRHIWDLKSVMTGV